MVNGWEFDVVVSGLYCGERVTGILTGLCAGERVMLWWQGASVVVWWRLCAGDRVRVWWCGDRVMSWWQGEVVMVWWQGYVLVTVWECDVVTGWGCDGVMKGLCTGDRVRVWCGDRVRVWWCGDRVKCWWEGYDVVAGLSVGERVKCWGEGYVVVTGWECDGGVTVCTGERIIHWWEGYVLVAGWECDGVVRGLCTAERVTWLSSSIRGWVMRGSWWVGVFLTVNSDSSLRFGNYLLKPARNALRTQGSLVCTGEGERGTAAPVYSRDKPQSAKSFAQFWNLASLSLSISVVIWKSGKCAWVRDIKKKVSKLAWMQFHSKLLNC